MSEEEARQEDELEQPPSIPDSLETEQGIVAYSEQHSGPLPHPRILAQYDQVVENGAERIFRMTERQSEHRIERERHDQKHSTIRSYLGLVMGFTLAIGLSGSGIYLVSIGRIEGLAAFIGPLASIVYAFIHTQHIQREDRREERELIRVLRRKEGELAGKLGREDHEEDDR